MEAGNGGRAGRRRFNGDENSSRKQPRLGETATGLWERHPFVAARRRLGLTGVDDRAVAGGAGVAIVASQQVFDESVNS